MSGHSPGPWSACHKGECSCSLVWTAGHPVAEVTRGKWGDSYPAIRLVEGEGMSGTKAEAYMERMDYGEIDEATAVANARLIAAAPELLEMLTRIEFAMVVMDGYEEKPNTLPEWIEKVRAVIAKATQPSAHAGQTRNLRPGAASARPAAAHQSADEFSF